VVGLKLGDEEEGSLVGLNNGLAEGKVGIEDGAEVAKIKTRMS
jgi:hypothetical protein